MPATNGMRATAPQPRAGAADAAQRDQQRGDRRQRFQPNRDAT